MRVLVAIDGSECADVAVDLVGGLDWPSGTEIEVVEVVPAGIAVFGGPWPPAAPVDTSMIDRSIREQADLDLKTAVEKLAAPGRTVSMLTATGRAGDTIVSTAEQAGAQLIVVGSRGHGTLETMLLGSVSSEVIDHAHVPVLLARGREIKRVVYAWDGSDRAEAAVPVLTAWGVFGDAHVDVLSVADAEPPWWVRADMVGGEAWPEAYHDAAVPSRHQHEEMADQMAQWLRTAGLSAVPHCREGDPAEAIVDFARAHEVDLIVLGTHGRTGLRRLFLGSVARNVTLHAPCSVLVAR
jgi:nucleotide-binding universal stress UspA family protein